MSNAMGQRGKISAVNLQPEKSERSENACWEVAIIFAGAAGEPVPARAVGVINFP